MHVDAEHFGVHGAVAGVVGAGMRAAKMRLQHDSMTNICIVEAAEIPDAGSLSIVSSQSNNNIKSSFNVGEEANILNEGDSIVDLRFN